MHKLTCQSQNYNWGKKGKDSFIWKILEKNSKKIIKKLIY
jgi:hypothetical protein